MRCEAAAATQMGSLNSILTSALEFLRPEIATMPFMPSHNLFLSFDTNIKNICPNKSTQKVQFTGKFTAMTATKV